MKRFLLLALVLMLAVFVMPTYADPPIRQVEVVNGPDAAVPVQGDVQVTNTVDADANITNTAENPVQVTGELTVVDGAAQKTIRSGYAETIVNTEPTKVLLTVSAGKTFILTDIVGNECPECDNFNQFSILENDTVKFTINFNYEETTVKTKSVHLNSGVPFAAGSEVVLDATEDPAVAILITGYEIDN